MRVKKKILHIVEAFGGGMFTFLADLSNGLLDEYEVVIAYGKRKETPDNFKEYFCNNIRFIEIKSFTRSINFIKDFNAFCEIKKIIKEENPDIIHLHSSKAGFIGRFAANGNKIKMLYNPHGFSFFMKNSSKLKRKIYWFIEKIASYRKCIIIGCSKGEYEEALKLTKNAICINNGINLTDLQKEIKYMNTVKTDFNNLKICTLGRIDYQKNPYLFNEIAKSFPQFKFTWIGDGYLKEILNSPNIKVTGWKERKEVLNMLNENDVFILTSLWEGMPISLLEALFMKKLCIVNNCIGNNNVINNKNGLLCNNLEDFQKAISDVYNGKIETEILISQGFEDVKNIYNVENMVSEYKKVYNS